MARKASSYFSYGVPDVADSKEVSGELLRDGYLQRPHPTRLNPKHRLFGEIMRVHGAAVAAGVPVYRDPVSGLSVFTAAMLAERGYCCSSSCRHCPYLV